ncbi:hypothetical protein B8A06_13615 [Staphylococcus aureus]|nr:hypothetical protein B8A06_13615 [Staphylococcus aureus]
MFFFFFQTEDGIQDLVRARGLGKGYKEQGRKKGKYVRTEPYARWCEGTNNQVMIILLLDLNV